MTTQYIIGTGLLGVYATDSLTAPQAWAAANGGLGSTNIIEIAPEDDNLRQYCLDGAALATRVISTRTTGAWSPILTTAQARVLTGEADPNSTIIDIGVDQVNGDVYALFTVESLASTVPLYALRSGDQGGTWAAYVVEATGRHSVIGNIVANNGNVACSSGWRIPGRSTVFVSTDSAATWTPTASFSATRYAAWVFINSYAPTFFYCRGGIAGDDLYRVNFDASTLLLQAGVRPLRPDSMVFEDALTQKVYDFSTELLHETANAWGAYTTQAVADQDSIYLDGSTLLFASDTPSPDILSRYLGAGAVIGVSGPNPDVVPYVDSIPETCGGVAIRGGFVKGESVGVFVRNVFAPQLGRSVSVNTPGVIV